MPLMAVDPNLFHLDWDRTFEALAGIVVLSFLVERVCALPFESRWWVRNAKTPEAGSKAADRELALLKPALDVLEASSDEEVAKVLKAKSTPGDHPLQLCAGNVECARATGGEIVEQARRRTRRREALARVPIKELVATAVALSICWARDFDAVAIILLSKETGFPGVLVSALVVAGGSKASVKLFRDILGFQSTAYRDSKKDTET